MRKTTDYPENIAEGPGTPMMRVAFLFATMSFPLEVKSLWHASVIWRLLHGPSERPESVLAEVLGLPAMRADALAEDVSNAIYRTIHDHAGFWSKRQAAERLAPILIPLDTHVTVS